MKKLSVCIICKNEESTIENCLESVKWADEIVIVDSGSTDKTLEIAKKYTDKIFIRDDWQGFGEQRRRAEKLATNDWLFAIDCDEVVTSELQQEILKTLGSIKDKQVISVNRLTKFCGKYIYHSGWHPDRIVRIYNKNITGYNTSLVHEAVDKKGLERLNMKGKLLHHQYEDLFPYINKRNKYAMFGAEQILRKNKKASLTKALSSAIFAFIRHYFLRLGFLDGKAGLIISIIQSQYSFNKHIFAYYHKDNIKK
jgi:(heptosyl)LPS beta-1,4-glucosyltransferase